MTLIDRWHERDIRYRADRRRAGMTPGEVAIIVAERTREMLDAPASERRDLMSALHEFRRWADR